MSRLIKAFLFWFWGGERKRMTCIRCGKVSAPYTVIELKPRFGLCCGLPILQSKMGAQHVGWVREENGGHMVSICPDCLSEYSNDKFVEFTVKG